MKEYGKCAYDPIATFNEAEDEYRKLVKRRIADEYYSNFLSRIDASKVLTCNKAVYDSLEQKQLAGSVFKKHANTMTKLAMDERREIFPKTSYEEILKLLWKGKEKYPDDKWKVLSIDTHLHKALGHIEYYGMELDPDVDSPSHLINAAVRLIFAIELLLNEELDGS